MANAKIKVLSCVGWVGVINDNKCSAILGENSIGCYGIEIWHEKHTAYCANLSSNRSIWYGIAVDYQFRNSLSRQFHGRSQD